MDRTHLGGCACGRVRYLATGEPYDVAHCHCSSCRHAVGAAFVTWASFARERFAFTSGAPRDWNATPESVRAFCADCGTSLTYRRHDEPGEVVVTLASFDDPEAVAPVRHEWTSRKLRWIALGDGLPQFPSSPGASAT